MSDETWWNLQISNTAPGGRWEWRLYRGPEPKAGKTNYATFHTAAAGAAKWMEEHGVVIGGEGGSGAGGEAAATPSTSA